MKNNFLRAMPLLLFLMIIFSAIHANAQSYKQTPVILTFKDAGEAAIAASKELQSEYASHSLKESAWVLGRRSYFPKMSLSAYEDERLSKISTDTFMKNYSLGLEQVIFDGGRLHTSRKIEKAKLALEYNNLKRSSSEISESAISMYRQILASRLQLEIMENGFKSLEEQRRILKSEVDLGMALDRDLSAADISLKESTIEILTAKIDLEEIEKQFTESLGLDRMPLLCESIDINRNGIIPELSTVRAMALINNPDLVTAQLSIKEKQEEAKYAFLSWIPTLSATGQVTIKGTSYPLTHYSWSVGLAIQFSSPYLSGKSGFSTGFEDHVSQNMNVQGSVEPLPDIASGVKYSHAKIALNLEKDKYNISFERLGRTAETIIEKCKFAEQKRKLAVDSQNLALEKLELTKLKHKLGLLTGIDLIDAQVQYTQKELEVVQAALSVLSVEREVEKLMDLQPGELKDYAASEYSADSSDKKEKLQEELYEN
ncbi:MAG: hypothetical protein Ta2F_04290 [Termitinemataceae bacterium]|nr:MAG: hypothetical protein Ta2F_04290 [Termitinemataceae bacterium]